MQVVRCVNQIEQVCKDIEKTINQTIQNTLNALEKDCERIATLIEQHIEDDDLARAYNLRASGKGVLFSFIGCLIPLLLIINFLVSNTSKDFLKSVIGAEGTDLLCSVRQFWDLLPEEHHSTTLLVQVGLSFILLGLARWTFTNLKKTLSRKHKRRLADYREYVQTVVKSKKHVLYGDYLQQSVAEYDL